MFLDIDTGLDTGTEREVVVEVHLLPRLEVQVDVWQVDYPKKIEELMHT